MKVLTHLIVLMLVTGSTLVNAQAIQEGLTLKEAVHIAIDADPWLTGSRYTQSALADEATAAATLPDPKMISLIEARIQNTANLYPRPNLNLEPISFCYCNALLGAPAACAQHEAAWLYGK